MENQIAVPDTQTVDSKAVSSVAQAQAMTIRTAEDYTVADRFCVALKALEKEVIDTFADAKAKAFAAHKAITAAEARHLVPVQEARKIAKEKMSAWQDAEDAKRRDEEKRLADEARKKAEDEAISAAEAEESNGNHAQAEAIMTAPVVVAPVVLAKTTPKSQTVIRKVWTYRADKSPKDLTNAELLAARAYLNWDTTRLTNQARATQDTIKVPGVTFFQKAI